MLRARNNPRSLLPFLSRELSRRSRPLAPPPSLTRSGGGAEGARARLLCPRQHAGHCAATPGSPRAATGRSRGPLRAECGLRSGRREQVQLSTSRAFHALLCVPKHPLRSSVASPKYCPRPRRPRSTAATASHCGRPCHHRYPHLRRPCHRPRPHAAATIPAATPPSQPSAAVASRRRRPPACRRSHPLASSRPTALARRPPCHHRHLHRLALTAALPPQGSAAAQTHPSPGPLRAATGRSRGPLQAE